MRRGSKSTLPARKFQLCGLLPEDKIVSLDSSELGEVQTVSPYNVKDACWAMFNEVPYKATIESIHKAVRKESQKVEHLFLLSWKGFDRSWNSYVWLDKVLATNEANDEVLESAQRTAFGKTHDKRKKSGSSRSSKPKTSSNGANDNDDFENDLSQSDSISDDGDDGDDGDDDADNNDRVAQRKRSKKSGGTAPVAAVASSSGRRSGEDELRRPIMMSAKETPQAAASKPWAENDPRLHGRPLEGSVITLAFPQELVAQLTRSQAWIKENGFLLPLPRSPTVVDILNDFVRDGNEEDYANRFHCAQAFVQIFDTTFALLLLYKNERAQYEQLKPLERSGPSTVYGAEHLLRFLSRAPEVFGVVPMEPEVTRLYERMLNQLLLFLKAKRRDYFVSV
jgi:hypothetical protein